MDKMREEIARIIDPEAFDLEGADYPVAVRRAEIRQDEARKKADQILPLLSSVMGSDLGKANQAQSLIHSVDCILRKPPEPVSHPNQAWCDAYADWHDSYVIARRKVIDLEPEAAAAQLQPPSSDPETLGVLTASENALPAMPEEMSNAAKEALSIMLWQSGSLARAYRAAGFDIPHKAEEEQAFVLYRTLRHALLYGDEWRERAQAELNALRDARAASSVSDEQPKAEDRDGLSAEHASAVCAAETPFPAPSKAEG